jgi:hypothetical protein
VNCSLPVTSPRRRASDWTGTERVLAGTSVLSLGSLFLPWFSVQIVGTAAISFMRAPRLGQISGIEAHTYLWMAFTLQLLILALIISGPALKRWPRQGSARPQLTSPSITYVLAMLASTNLILILAGFLSKPSANLGVDRLLVLWQRGAVIALILAALTAGAAVLNLLRPRKATAASATRPDVS